jgi:hypothetical protein
MSPELCLCSKKSWTVAFVSHRLGLQARDILRSIFASLGGLNIEETRTSSFPCTSCNRRVDSLPLILSVWAQNTPGYNNKIPPQIMTPDTFDDLPCLPRKRARRSTTISISCAALRCSSTSFRQPPSKQSSGHGRTGLRSRTRFLFSTSCWTQPRYSSRAIPTPFTGEALEETHSSLSHIVGPISLSRTDPLSLPETPSG